METTQEPEDDLMLSRAAHSDDEALSFIVADKMYNFFRSRTLRYKMFEDADIVVTPEARGSVNIGLSIKPLSVFESGRGRLRRQLAPLIAAVATKIGIIAALLFKAVILLVGKALIVSKIALVLAVFLGLKKLLAKKHVTYEVVAHPHHTESHHGHGHDSYSTGWGRALDGFLEGIESGMPVEAADDAHVQAYNGQVKSSD